MVQSVKRINGQVKIENGKWIKVVIVPLKDGRAYCTSDGCVYPANKWRVCK